MSFSNTEHSTTGSTGIIHMFQEALLYSQPATSRQSEELQKLLKLLPTYLVQCTFLITSASICQLQDKFCLNLTCQIPHSFVCGT
jgi:hypothetical protein